MEHHVDNKPSPSLTSLMDATERGEASAADALFGALYAELHRLAKSQLSRQGAQMSLGATTLLHQPTSKLRVETR